ncbi:hypothetical protein WAK64_22190 [Bacillus spongiae]|uniref:Uncharacterized protein n=1 Tax=Bacillus spongiae TaxID=2683610 RepID=A0ABU8HKV9_9BACI
MKGSILLYLVITSVTLFLLSIYIFNEIHWYLLNLFLVIGFGLNLIISLVKEQNSPAKDD